MAELIGTLFGTKEVPVKRCKECLQELPFEKFGKRNATKHKPELLNTCKSCKSKHDKVVREWKKYNKKPNLNFKCPICKEPSSEIKARHCGFHEHQPKDVWAVDVDHETMTVRGWICDYCNNMIGRSHDRPEVLENGAEWIREHKEARIAQLEEQLICNQ